MVSETLEGMSKDVRDSLETTTDKEDFRIIASYSFKATDAATFFHRGYSICLGFICLSAASCVAYYFAVLTQNRSRAKNHDVGLTEYEKIELGDMSPSYRYMY